MTNAADLTRLGLSSIQATPRGGRRAANAPTLSRRKAIGGLFGGMAICGGGLATLPRPVIGGRLPGPVHAWGAFKERFASGDRIVDTGNGGVSHSEGQGIALLAAAHSGDQQAFDRIYAWTSETLRRPWDSLHAWRYQPNAPNPVDDMNNATDGDLLIALALFTAGDRFGRGSYYSDAMAMTRDVLRSLVVESSHGTVLLPGLRGFSDKRSVTVNPSYYIFPALIRMSRELPDPAWRRVHDDGLALLRQARFGRWQLPPDWVTLPSVGGMRPAASWPARFSFDAVRVPLYLCWAGLSDEPAVRAVHDYWVYQEDPAIPAWTDVVTGERAPYKETAGMAAIRQYVAASLAQDRGSAAVPNIASAPDYYSAALILLVQIAMGSTLPQTA